MCLKWQIIQNMTFVKNIRVNLSKPYISELNMDLSYVILLMQFDTLLTQNIVHTDFKWWQNVAKSTWSK